MSAPLSCTASVNLGPIGTTIEPLPSHPSPNDNPSNHRNISNSGELRLLVVDKSKKIRKMCCEVAEGLGFAVSEAENANGAREILNREETTILLLDLPDGESGNQSLFEEMKARYPETLVIVMSSGATISSAVDAMRMGACDYLSKPFPLEVLTEGIQRTERRWYFRLEQRVLQEALPSEAKVADVLGKSPEMEKLYRMLSEVTKSTHPVMIVGESGTDKATVAMSIHSNGPQASKPFVSLDCSSLGSALLEETLFGYGTKSSKRANFLGHSLLTSSQGGTVFLEEIGDLPLEIQGKLAKALEDGEIVHTDEAKGVRISVRVLTATSQDLTQMVNRGLFRRDLYNLLSMVNLKIPPLRGHPNDIVFLATRFLEKVRGQAGLSRTLSDETIRMLGTYDWPDNPQELKDTIARAFGKTPGLKIEAADCPQKLFNVNNGRDSSKRRVIPISQMEKRAILRALRETNGDKMMAAELLGIGKTTLYRKLKEYGLSQPSEAAMRSDLSLSTSDETGAQPISLKAVV